MKQLIAGNWKMHGQDAAFCAQLAASINQPEHVDICVAPPATYIHAINDIAIAGQDCHYEPRGAFTGNISAKMLKNAGASYVILGHSERREHHKESSSLISKKAQAAIEQGLHVILCVGENLETRESGNARNYVSMQLMSSLPKDANHTNCTIAYEPIWAIGTGKVATIENIENMHTTLYSALKNNAFTETRILYGGSVKPNNAKEILNTAHVGGVLVGGASLKADDFNAIIAAAPLHK